jgi:peptidoglycan/xylan/chitin deacetylase (PgdA/CDA1 family)
MAWKLSLRRAFAAAPFFTVVLASACRDNAVTNPPTEGRLPAAEVRAIPAPTLSSLRSTAPTVATCAPEVSYQVSDGSRIVGNVSVSNDAQTLYVTYAITAPHWWVSDTRLAVARTAAEIPKDDAGQPEPWSFPYAGVHEPPVTSYTYALPLSGVPAQGGSKIVVSAMAGVVHPVDESNYGGAWEWLVMWGVSGTAGALQTIHEYTVAQCAGQPAPPPVTGGGAMITLTFDDGWKTTITNVYPVLRELGLKGNVAVNPQPIDELWSSYMRLADFDTLKEAGWSIVSHSISHPDLTTLSADSLDKELRVSQAWVQSHGFGPTNVFIVPFHAWGSRERAAIEKYYTYARGHTVDQFYPEQYVKTPITTPLDLTAYEPEFAPFTTAAGRAATMAKVKRAVDEGDFLDLMFHRIATAQLPAFKELMSQVAAYKSSIKTWGEVAR